MNAPARLVLPRMLALTLLFGVAAELCLRWTDFRYPGRIERLVIDSREGDPELRAGTGLHVIDRCQLWKPRPGAPIPGVPDETINAAGYRGPLLEREKRPGVLRIAVLGDGVAFAPHVPWRDTFAAQLVRELGLAGVPAEVMLAAVCGTTARQGVERYRELVRPFRPDLVLCSYRGANAAKAAPLGESDGERIAKLCALLPPLGGQDAEVDQQRIARLACHPLRSRLRLAHVFAWLEDIRQGGYWRERERELHELRLTATVDTFQVGGIRRVPPREFFDCLAQIEHDVSEDGGRMILVSVPDEHGFLRSNQALLVYGDFVAEFAQRSEVPLVDGMAALEEAVRRGIPQSDLFVTTNHLSHCGHGLVSRALCEQVLLELSSTGAR